MSVEQMGKVWSLDLDHTEAWILMSLADHADHGGGSVRPSVGLMIWKTGYSRSTIRRAFKKFQTMGVMVKTREAKGRGNPPEYRLDLDKAPKKMPYHVWKEQQETEGNEQKQKGVHHEPLSESDEKGSNEPEKGFTQMDPEPSHGNRHSNTPSSSEPKGSSSESPQDDDKSFRALSEDEAKAETLRIVEENGELGEKLMDLIRVAASENKTRKISAGRAYSKFAAKFEQRKHEFSDEAWHKGFDAALNAGAGHFNYVVPVARKHHMKTAADEVGFVGGIPDRSSKGSPPAVIEAIANYEGKTGDTYLREYVDVARDWDFTSEERPPWPILSRLGNSDEERETYLRRLRKVASRAMKEAG